MLISNYFVPTVNQFPISLTGMIKMMELIQTHVLEEVPTAQNIILHELENDSSVKGRYNLVISYVVEGRQVGQRLIILDGKAYSCKEYTEQILIKKEHSDKEV